MKCKNCRWFSSGGCRFRAPKAGVVTSGGGVVMVDGRGEPTALWPRVNEDDFCGEYEQNRK